MGISAYMFSSHKQTTTFTDEYGNWYQVMSEDSLTCRLLGRADSCTSANLYIEPTISYGEKAYQVTEIAESAFMGDKHLQTFCLPHTLLKERPAHTALFAADIVTGIHILADEMCHDEWLAFHKLFAMENVACL